MNKNNRGFFLSETMVVMAIVAIVLVSVFKIFSTTYSKYKESENYNTVNAIIAAASVKKYFSNVGIDNAELLNDSSYVELTNLQAFDTAYYDVLKQTLDIEHIYLIDTTLIFNGTNINALNADLRKYIKKFKNGDNRYIFIVTLNNDEYGSSLSTASYEVTLVGNIEDEYVAISSLGSDFVDPGYTGWSGSAPTTTWETTFNKNVEGTYYLRYDFNGYLLRRKVIVTQTEFAYTGALQMFVVPTTGWYQIELWGAQGGQYSTYTVGKGGYVSGKILINMGEKYYIYVGGSGSTASASSTFTSGGYNGGGSANYSAGTGGGSTDIRYGGTTLYNRIMVAAGGGGTGVYASTEIGGNAGGLIGTTGGHNNSSFQGGGGGGTQLAGGTLGSGSVAGTIGTFGIGGTGGYEASFSHGAGAGGGGYWGGAGGSARNGGGGGGSSFISGHTGCVAITSSGTPKSGCDTETTDNSCSIHYSDKVLIDTLMIDGSGYTWTNEKAATAGTNLMPNPRGGNYASGGNTGDGYAKITFVGTSYTPGQ